MSLFDHLLFGANVDGWGSRTHPSGRAYAFALLSADANRADISSVVERTRPSLQLFR